MALVTETFTGVKCDCCGTLYENPQSGFSYWFDKDHALESAYDDEWEVDEENDKHYCPDCYHHDDEGNIIFHSPEEPQLST
jgi:hypothetical protein